MRAKPTRPDAAPQAAPPLTFFRKKEPLHWRLAREGGLEDSEREDLRPAWDKVGIHGVSRPRRWDAVVAAEAPELRGDAVEFVVLPDGTLIVGDDQEGDLTTLADALEAQLQAPYRAEGVRQHDQVWAVAGRRIDTLSFASEGEEVVLTDHGGERVLMVDGSQAFGSIPELEAVGRRTQADSYVVRARRLDGDVWEVQADPL